MGYDPVWEPFFVFNNGRLICYYSDERIPNGKQKLVYSLNRGTGNGWESPVDILDYNGNGRPGMPILAQLTNGKWILVSEIPTRYKISDDLLNWEPVNTFGLEWGAGGGSPYVLALQDGRIVVGDGTLPRYLSTQSATAPVHGSNMKPARSADITAASYSCKAVNS